MKNYLIMFCTAAFAVCTMTSCGVMFGGSRFSGSIIAKDHPGAQIYVNGNQIGQGTAVGLFPRNKPLTVELKQAGCESKTQTFDNTLRAGNFVLSLAAWGLVGIAIDLATGASFKPDHKNNPAVQRLSDKNFIFTVDYAGCSTEVGSNK